MYDIFHLINILWLIPTVLLVLLATERFRYASTDVSIAGTSDYATSDMGDEDKEDDDKFGLEQTSNYTSNLTAPALAETNFVPSMGKHPIEPLPDVPVSEFEKMKVTCMLGFM